MNRLAIVHHPSTSRYALQVVLAGLALLVMAGPTLAETTRCLVPQLPRPAGDLDAIRAQLKAADLWHPQKDPSRTPPHDPQVGDTWDWYIWDLGGFPVATLKPCTVRGMGDNCYVVVDDDEWNVSIDQADVDIIVQNFENESVGNFPDQGIWDLNTSHFGDPPNPLDGLERIFLLYYRFGIAADGYFWYFDQFPDGGQFASNEADVVYLASDNQNTSSPYMLAVAAHEFEHMIHFNQDSNEDSWLDEGLGELAMWLYGNPDNISSFNSNSDNSLIDWGGAWADYIQTYLWSLYMYEQFGGQPLIWDLIHHPANGMLSYQMTLNDLGYLDTTEDIFGDWAVANFLDDTTIPDGQYGYLGDDLPAFTPFRTHTTFPASSSSSVSNWAAEYIRLAELDGVPTLEFNGIDSRDFRVDMLAVDSVLQQSLVRHVPLDEFNDGSYTFTEAAGYELVIISVANVYPSGSATYTYTVTTGPTDVPASAAGEIVLRNWPNPFNPSTQLHFTLPAEARVQLDVYNLRGQRVAQLMDADMPAGPHRIDWDSRDVPSGHFLARLVVDGRMVRQTKLAVVK